MTIFTVIPVGIKTISLFAGVLFRSHVRVDIQSPFCFAVILAAIPGDENIRDAHIANRVLISYGKSTFVLMPLSGDHS